VRKFKLAVIATLLVGSFALTGTATADVQSRDVSPNAITQLTTWWHSGRADNYGSGTVAGDNSAINAGYAFVRDEAWVETTQAAGTKPLWLYWNASRGDNFTTATTAGRDSAINAGYTFIRVEGYVYTSQLSGTVPLYTYWNASRGDNFSAASAAGINSAVAAGYTRIRVEGYVIPA
jgi:hypothetical protein